MLDYVARFVHISARQFLTVCMMRSNSPFRTAGDGRKGGGGVGESLILISDLV